jgi:hypothetical protein
MPLSDRKAGATNYPLNQILKIRFALVVCFISIFSLINSDNLKGRARKIFHKVIILFWIFFLFREKFQKSYFQEKLSFFRKELSF